MTESRRHFLEALGCDPTAQPLDRGTIADPAPPGLSRGYALAEPPPMRDLDVRDIPEVSARLRDQSWSVTRTSGTEGYLLIGTPGLELPARTADLAGVILRPEENMALVRVAAFRGAARFRGEQTECDLVMFPGESGDLGWELHGSPRLEPPPVPSIESPLLGWVESEAAWLGAACRELLATGEPYDHFAGLGLYARLRTRSPEERQANLAAILAGRPLPQPCPARRWAREQQPELLDYLERAARSESVRLEHLIDAYLDGNEPDRTLRNELAHGRDLLQGAAVLLRVASPERADHLAETLEPLDQRGEILAAAAPTDSAQAEDPHLECVAELEPDLWWVRLGRASS